MIRALPSLAATACLWSEIARGQELQNGVWMAYDGLAYPSLQVPDGQARLEFEVTSVRATYDNTEQDNITLTLTASINSLPSKNSCNGGPDGGTAINGIVQALDIPSPVQAGNYWFHLFPAGVFASSLYSIISYQLRGTFYPPAPSIATQPVSQTKAAGLSVS